MPAVELEVLRRVKRMPDEPQAPEAPVKESANPQEGASPESAPSTAPSSSPPPDETPQEQQARERATLAKQLAERGIDIGDAGDDQAIEVIARSLAQARRAMAQYQEFQPKLSQYEKDREAYEQWRQQQQGQKPQQEKPWHSEYWSPPEWDHSWQRRLGIDPETKQIVLRDPNDDPGIISKYKAYQSYIQNWRDQFENNPYQALQPAIDRRAEEIARRIVDERFSEYQDQQAATSFLQSRDHFLFERDSQGQKLRDPMTGQPILSRWGQMMQNAVAQEYDRYQRMGQRPDQQHIQEIADLRVSNAYYQSPEYLQQVIAQYQQSQQQADGEGEAPVQVPESPLQKANKEILKKTPGQPRKGKSQPAKEAPRSFAEQLKETIGAQMHKVPEALR